MGRQVRLTLLVAGAFGLNGCADALVPLDVPTQPSAAYESFEDLPPEYHTSPSINRSWADAGFEGSYAYGQAFMNYWANRAQQSVSISLRYGHSPVSSTTAAERQSFWLPGTRSFWTDASLWAGGSCGYTVDTTSTHLAYHEALFTTGWFAWGHDQRSNSRSASQGSCGECSGNDSTYLVDPGWDTGYDPYDPWGTGGGGCGSGGSGEGGGDGGGGGGDCTTEYVIIEVYDESTGTWSVWWEGYATVCD
jgi:hypothetical protein